MIRTLIIDDEEDARYLLSNIIRRNFADLIEIVGEADGIDSGKLAIEQHLPELVFLDVKMPGGTGFDLLETFNKVDFEVIFITAYDSHAVKAFQFSAFGYIMKPIKLAELEGVIRKLELHKRLIKDSNAQRLKVLIESYRDEQEVKKLVLGNMEGFKVVNLQELIRLEGVRNYTNFVLENGTEIIVSKTLGEYETLLNEYGFFRAHQSSIVNLRHVKGYLKGDGGEIEMTDGKFVKLSRNRKADFIKRFI